MLKGNELSFYYVLFFLIVMSGVANFFSDEVDSSVLSSLATTNQKQ
jgi:hypothetical protein